MKKLNVLVYDKLSKEIENFLKESYDLTVNKVASRGGVDLSTIDLIIMNGEEKGDVHPERYSELVGKYTNIKESYWGKYETLRDYTYGRNIPILAIADGAEFITVVSGGSLIQHVLGHDKDHALSVYDSSKTLTTPSDHHQLMYPFDLPSSKYNVLAWSKYFQSITYLNGRNEEKELNREFVEPEIIAYTNKAGNALAIQGNPGKGNEDFKKFCMNEIENLLKA